MAAAQFANGMLISAILYMRTPALIAAGAVRMCGESGKTL